MPKYRREAKASQYRHLDKRLTYAGVVARHDMAIVRGGANAA